MKAVLMEVLNMSVMASIAALAVILVRLLLKKAPKIFSYALWAIVLFKLLCPFKLESAFSVLPSSANTVPQSIIYSQAPTTPINVEPVINTESNTVAPPSETAIMPDPVDTALNIAVWVWLAGIVMLLGYAVLSYLRLKLRLKASVLVRDNIWETDRITAPFVLGFIKPRIYLPLGMGDTEHILAHEQTHIRRRDYLVKPTAFFALCLHWFNPVVWLSYFLMCKDMEMSCDESVLSRSAAGGEIKRDYSQSLLALSVKQSGLLSPLAFGESNAKSRIRNVLKYKKASMWIIIAAVVAVVAVTVGFVATRGDEGITADEAVEQLVGSVTYADGQVSFQIPAQFYSPGDWNIHISGRAEAEDGMSMSVHEFEDVNDAHAWEAGKVYTIPVEGRNLTELTMDIFLPGDNGGTAEGSVDLLAGVTTSPEPVSAQAPAVSYDSVNITFLSDVIGFKDSTSLETDGTQIASFIDNQLANGITHTEKEVDLEANYINRYQIELSNRTGGYSAMLYYDTLYDAAYVVKDGGMYTISTDFARYINKLFENTGMNDNVQADAAQLFADYGWTIDYQINAMNSKLGDIVNLSDFNTGLYYFAYNNELSKDIGLDMSGYPGEVAVEIYRLYESMPPEFYPTLDCRGIVVRSGGKIIGAYVSAGRHSTFSACSLKGNRFETVTGQTVDEWLASVVEAGEGDERLAKLTPEGIIAEYFTALDTGDYKTAESCLSKSLMLGNLTSNISDGELFNAQPGLPLSESYSYNTAKALDNLKSAELLDVELREDISQTVKIFKVNVNLQYKEIVTIDNGEQVWDGGMVYESSKTGWKITGFGHG